MAWRLTEGYKGDAARVNYNVNSCDPKDNQLAAVLEAIASMSETAKAAIIDALKGDRKG